MIDFKHALKSETLLITSFLFVYSFFKKKEEWSKQAIQKLKIIKTKQKIIKN